MTTNEAPPAIRHWLKRHGAPMTTVTWITKDGDQKTITGRVAGWATTSGGTPYLIVDVHARNQGPARYEKTRIPSAALARWLDQQGTSTRPRPSVERCQDCGQVLGTGPNGYLADLSAVAGYCYDCA